MSIRRRRWPARPVPVAPVYILVLLCALAVPAGMRPVAAQDPCPPGAPPTCLLPHERYQPPGAHPEPLTASNGDARSTAGVTAGPLGVPADVDIIDLGTLGGSGSVANGINNAGQVVGWSYTASGNDHAFIWTAEAGMQDLGTLGGSWSEAQAINNAGHVVGSSGTASGGQYPFIWTAEAGMRDLGTLGGHYSRANGINEAGHVVGSSETASWYNHAFIWTAEAGMQDLGLGEAYAINNAGQVVGTSWIAGGNHAFIWTAEAGMRDLGTLGGANSKALGINEAGQVVGASGTASGDYHAFLWTAEAGMQDLGTLGGWLTYASGINEVGQVVGASITASGDGHAFIWTAEAGMQDLGTLAGGSWSAAFGINDAGQVVGASGTASGAQHATLWTLSPDVTTAPLDVKPGTCPNALNTRSQGVTPLAIVGTNDLDVTTIDPTSIKIAGVTPLRSAIEDVATPHTPMTGKDSADDCTSAGPDGRPDLTLKVDTQALVAALGTVTDGQVVVVELTGTLRDGTPIRGEDVVVIKQKKQE